MNDLIQTSRPTRKTYTMLGTVFVTACFVIGIQEAISYLRNAARDASGFYTFAVENNHSEDLGCLFVNITDIRVLEPRVWVDIPAGERRQVTMQHEDGGEVPADYHFFYMYCFGKYDRIIVLKPFTSNEVDIVWSPEAISVEQLKVISVETADLKLRTDYREFWERQNHEMPD